MSALVQVEQFIVRGLPSLHPHVALRHRPFSSKMLYNILAHASRFPLREVTYQVLREKNRYVARLVQVGTAGGSGDFVDLDGDVVMQIHTHNQMPAFWSLTDDAHEVEFRWYGVVGRVSGNRPEVAFRAGVFGYFHPLPVTSLFRGDDLATRVIDKVGGA